MAGNEWVIKVTADVKDVLDASRQIGQAGKQAGQEFQQGFNGNDKTLSGLRGRLNELNQTLDQAAIGSKEFRRTQQEIAQTQREVDKALGQTSIAAKALGGVMSALGALGVGFSVAGFLKGSIEKAMELETTSRKLTNSLGPQGAAGALGFTRQLADNLGLSYADLSKNFSTFTAAATAAGVPLEQQKGLFAAVSKAGQALGLSNDEISGTFLALQQTASKGRVSMEELGSQLGERLPIALAAAAQGLGLNTAELIKLVESGKLTATEFFPALTKGLEALTSNAGGVPTAAQNFAKLQNAWDDLQTSFGTSLLPFVTEGVKMLAKALEGFKADMSAKDLRQSFGFPVEEAMQMGQQLNVIRDKYGLTNEQAKNLLSNAIANVGASKNWFGELNTGGGKFGKIQEEIVIQAMNWIATHKDQRAELNNLTAAEKKRLEDAKKLNDEALQQLATQQKISESQAKYGKSVLQNQVDGLQAQVNLSKALVDVIDSRFGVEKSIGTYLMNKAKEQGASEAQLANMKRQNEKLEQAAIVAKYNQLTKSQQLESKIFDIKQKMAVMDADQAVNIAKMQFNAADLKYRQNANEQTKAERDIAAQNLQIAQGRAATVRQIQPLEKQVNEYEKEKAINLVKQQAGALGFLITSKGTLQAVKSTALEFQSYGNSLKVPLSQQTEFARLAKSMGFDVRKNKDGFYEIGKALKETNVPPSDRVKKAMATTANALKGASGQARNLTDNTNNAADAAERFRDALVTAAGLPPARFTGGPVDAGQTYRVNDGPGGLSLGQEAFLSSSGVLSLINRPMNSLWTAPSRGTVIPAAVTSRLKDRGLLGGAGVLRSGTDPAVTHLTMAVGNLSQEVAELRRKAWNVSVGVRGDGSGLRLAQTMARMR